MSRVTIYSLDVLFSQFGTSFASALSMAESYPTSEVRDSRPECQAQEWPGGATPCPRSGAVAERSYPTSEVRGGWEKPPRTGGKGR